VPPAGIPAALGPALEWLDLAGIFVFAASGALVAAAMRPELYVTAAALSAALTVGLIGAGVPGAAAGLVAFAAGFALRAAAIVRGWSLPIYGR